MSAAGTCMVMKWPGRRATSASAATRSAPPVVGDVRPRIPDEQRHRQPGRSGSQGDADDGQVAEVGERLRRAGSRSALGLLLAASDPVREWLAMDVDQERTVGLALYEVRLLPVRPGPARSALTASLWSPLTDQVTLPVHVNAL
jgi:hypothetical protein